MKNIYLGVPIKNGFYKKSIKNNDDFVDCKFADSKQISKDRYELQHDLFYRAKDGKIIVIKKGFKHDGASKWIFKAFGKWTNPAILHDGLYSIKYYRKKSDDLFDEANEICDVAWLRRKVYYSFVRLFGGKAWSEKTKESVIYNEQFVKIQEQL